MAEVERDELELELGLSLGGGRRSFRRLETTAKPLDVDRETSLSFGREIDQTTTSKSIASPAVVSDQKTKREIHAMRRQEAKQKRREKRNRGLRNSSFEPDHCSNNVSPVMEDHDQERPIKRERIQYVSQTLPLHHQRQAVSAAVQYPFPSFQFVPFANGLSYPYMMPWWTPTAAADGKNVVQPVPCRGFGPFFRGLGFGSNVFGSGKNVGKAESEATKTTSNGGSSSTLVSDSFTRTHSSESSLEQNQRVEEKTNYEASPQNCSETTTVSEPEKQTPVAETKPSSDKAAELNRKPPKPPAKNGNGTPSPLQMPYVSTKGDGPDGKTVTGFLYRYTKSEVNIVCVCHGSTFSPAGFVEHAGGTDVSNPLKHITVIPSAF